MNATMNVNASSQRSPLKMQTVTASQHKKQTALAAPTTKQTDKVIISPQGRQAAQTVEPFSMLESGIPKGDMAGLMEAAKEQNGSLQINWNAEVDPDGAIYGAAYVEALVSQYEKASADIEAYYADAHQENLIFDDPYTHLLQKYKFPDSPYFRSDMAQTEREMAFEQERALLRGDHVNLKDPYALAASGGLLDAKEAEQIARQAAQEKLDGLIQARKEAIASLQYTY